MRKSVLVKACTVLMMAMLLLSACGQSKGTQKDNNTKQETNDTKKTDDKEKTDDKKKSKVKSPKEVSKYDENYSITDAEANDFYDRWLKVILQDSTRERLFENGIDDLMSNPTLLQTKNVVHAVRSVSMSHGGAGDGYVSYQNNKPEEMEAFAKTLFSKKVVSEVEEQFIINNEAYANGVYVISADFAQEFFDTLYGKGVVDAYSWKNYPAAFSSSRKKIITSTKLDTTERSEVTLEGFTCEANIATFQCKRVFELSDDKTKTENVTVIVYKDDTGLHFYSMSK